MPLVSVLIVGITQAHDDEDLAAVVAGARGPPFGAVEEPVVGFLLHAELDVGAVRRRDVGLGHEEARADLARQEGLEPFVLLSACAICVKIVSSGLL